MIEKLSEVSFDIPVLSEAPSPEEVEFLSKEKGVLVGINPRSKEIDKHIDCDVFLDGKWVAYTTTPTDTVSRGMYMELLNTRKVKIAPNIYHDWIDGKWVPFNEERMTQWHSFERNARIRDAERQMEPLLLAEKLGVLTTTEQESLLKLRHYVLALHRMDLTKIELVWPVME